MKVYEGPGGTVIKGLFTGFRLTIRSTGRSTRLTRWMKKHMAELQFSLARRGYDVISNPVVATVFWEHLLDLASSPPNGLYHQAIASSPIEETVAELVADIASHDSR